MTEQEFIKKATLICCPLCDEKKCVGRHKCQEVKEQINKLKKEDAVK